MKISCDVIRDLLPLYAEGMISRDTRVLIAEHMKKCPVCKRYLRSLQTKDANSGMHRRTGDYSFVAKRLRTKRMTTQTAVGLVILTLLGYAVYKNFIDDKREAEVKMADLKF